MKSVKNKSITQPHDAIIARLQLSAREQDLVTLAFMEVKKFADKTKVKLSQFDPNQPENLNDIPTICTFSEKSVASLLGVTVKALNIKNQDNGKTFLHNVCRKLISRRTETNVNDGTFLVANLLSEAECSHGVLRLEVTRSQAARMLDYGLNRNNFTRIDAKLVLGFKSRYTKRIFELISRFKNAQDYSTTLGELYDMLGTSADDHADFSRFKRNVLDRPIAQIVKDSCGVWQIKEGKGYIIDSQQGKKVTERIRITFKMKFHDPEQPKQST